jgi:integrase
MGRRGRKPEVRWWNRQGGGYFCTHNGKKVALSLGLDDAPNGPCYLKALDEFARLMRQEIGLGTDGYAVSALFNAYRQHLAERDQTAMLNNVNNYLHPFALAYGTNAVADLRGFQVREWLRKAKTWGPSSRRLAVKLLMGALNWGVRDGLIASNPLKGKVEVPKDKPRGRECRLSPELADLLIASASPAFARVLLVLRRTGARPEEIEQCTARDFKGDRIVYHWNASEGHIHKTARRGKQVDRVIYLPPDLVELCCDLAARHKTGAIFRTQTGKPWNKFNRVETFDNLLHKPAVAKYLQAHKINPDNIVPYSFRHTWISEWIDSGRSVKLCADLCGTSVAQIERVYGHADEQNLQNVYLAFMREEQARMAAVPASPGAAG